MVHLLYTNINIHINRIKQRRDYFIWYISASQKHPHGDNNDNDDMSTKLAIFIMIIWFNGAIMTFGHITGIILEDEPVLLPSSALSMSGTSTISGANAMRFGNSNAAGGAPANTEDEVLIVATNTGNIGTNGGSGANNIAAGQTACTVEFQVMKKYPGRCVRLGKSVRGCVAGNHIVPFHPDCF